MLKDPESTWSMSNPFQDFDLSQQKSRNNLLGEMRNSLKTSNGEVPANVKSGGLRKLCRNESQWYRGRYLA